jgi:hypothetical protein
MRTALGRSVLAIVLGWGMTLAAAPSPAKLSAKLPAKPPAPLPADAWSPRNANYSIDAELDPVRRLLSGREVITWRNISRTPTSELRLHLYYNAWRSSESTWMRERRMAGLLESPDTIPQEDWAYIDVTAIRLLGAGAAPPIDLTAHARFIAPDDENPRDQTMLTVPLPEAVGPEGTVNLAVEWTLHVPRTFARTGAIGNFFFFAQWFPKVAVYRDGWTSHQFHGATEFFSDYGVYDVRLTVPRGWVVGATGQPQPGPAAREGSTLHRYVQPDVHDFAWVTSPDLVERRARFDDRKLPAVEMRLLLLPEHVDQADRHFTATRAVLKHYGDWFGAYPYGHITIVDPAWQSGAGGMEYPTLFTAGTRWWAPRGGTQPESVTVHEAGHQFWYGLVGNNEFEHAWLDEGFNQFSQGRTMEAAFPPFHYSERFFGGFVPWLYRDVLLSRAVDFNGLNYYRRSATTDAEATPSWRYFPATGPNITYNKTALWLQTLERMLGWPTLQRIMFTFSERYRFKHPGPEEFFAVANEVSGQDLTWFFNQVYRGSGAFDYGLADLTSEPLATTGFTGGGAQRKFVRDETVKGVYRTTVRVRRYGDGLFPVDVRVQFANGESVRERWDGRDRWKVFVYERPSRAVAAQVDPGRVLLLDVNYTNNTFTLDPAAKPAATKWSLAWLVWLQDLLLTYGYFA